MAAKYCLLPTTIPKTDSKIRIVLVKEDQSKTISNSLPVPLDIKCDKNMTSDNEEQLRKIIQMHHESDNNNDEVETIIYVKELPRSENNTNFNNFSDVPLILDSTCNKQIFEEIHSDFENKANCQSQLKQNNKNKKCKRIILDASKCSSSTLTRNDFTTERTWQLFVDYITFKRKELKTLKQRCGRLQGQIDSYKSIIQSLHNRRLVPDTKEVHLKEKPDF